MTNPQETAIPEDTLQPEPSSNNLNKTTIQISSSDLPSEVRDSEGLIANRSMRHSTGFKPKGGQRYKEYMQLGNACALNSFKKDVLVHREFRHPWAMSVKSRSIRIKTDRNRRNSTDLMEQRVTTDHGKEQKVIHSLRVKQDKLVKKVPLFDDQHPHLRLKTDHKKWTRILKQQNLLKRQIQEKQSQRQSQQDLIDVVNKKEAEAKKQRQRKRQSILDQRMKKQKAVENVHKEKADYAFRQRLASYQLKTERREVEDYQMYEKRLIYQRQKQEKFGKKQQRRPLSQSYSKWISDFHSTSRDKPNLTEKQHAFAQKMKIAIISLSQRQSPS